MANWSGGAQGALGGAGTGAYLGSFAGPWGTGIGGTLGGILGGLGGLFTGSEGGVKQNQRFDPQQQALRNQLFQQIMPLLQQGSGSQPNYSGFEPIAQNARTQFNTQTVPGLAERFTAMGGQGTRASSDFAGSLGAAGAGLEQGLAALRSQYGMQQQSLQQDNLRNLLNFAFQPSFENYYEQGTQGFGPALFSSAAQAAPQIYQGYQQGKQNEALMGLIKALSGK